MATIFDWNKYINAVHELALIEEDLRYELRYGRDSARRDLAADILYARF